MATELTTIDKACGSNESAFSYLLNRYDYSGTTAVDFTPIPQDFMEALDDYHKGKVIDMETALNERPPGVE